MYYMYMLDRIGPNVYIVSKCMELDVVGNGVYLIIFIVKYFVVCVNRKN